MDINPIGGVALYNSTHFLSRNINVRFLKAQNIKYKQFNNEFIPGLSIIDIMMFNSSDTIKDMLKMYTLLQQ